jgi:hypothetical protein
MKLSQWAKDVKIRLKKYRLTRLLLRCKGWFRDFYHSFAKTFGDVKIQIDNEYGNLHKNNSLLSIIYRNTFKKSSDYFIGMSSFVILSLKPQHRFHENLKTIAKSTINTSDVVRTYHREHFLVFKLAFARKFNSRISK